MKYAKRAAEMVNSPEYKTHRIAAIQNNFDKGFITYAQYVEQMKAAS